MRRFISLFGALSIVVCSGWLAAEEPNAAETAIRKALDAKTTVSFVETPLNDAVDYLQDHHKIQIVLDKKALDEYGVSSDTPITAESKDISLRSTLRLMLRPLDLKWVIENEVLSITTADAAGQKLFTRVYDVKDLVADEKLTDETNHDYDSLIDLITTTVNPETWTDVGGPGSVSPFRGMLVFSQTHEVHEHIASLLADLRRVRKERGDAAPRVADKQAAAPADPHAIVVKIYKVAVPLAQRSLPAIADASDKPKEALPQAGMTAAVTPNEKYLDELSRAIPALVRPETWERTGGGGVLFALPADASGTGHLLVRQTAEVHGQLQRFLSDLQSKGTGQGGIAGGNFF